MNLELKRTDDAALHLQQQGLPGVRLLFGIPLLGWGLLMLYGVGSSVCIRWQEDGVAGLPEALVGALFLLICASLLVPLGWWLVFARQWIVLPRGGRRLIQGSAWLIGRRERSVDLAIYRTLRVALEPVNSSPNPRRSGTKAALCQQIRLLAHDPDEHPSIELGAFEEGQRRQAISAAQEIAAHLGLPLEIGQEDKLYNSPAAELA